jgi:acyl dehydratase
MPVDKSVLGKEYPPFIYEVEKVKIKEMAEALEDPNPLYQDENFAGNSKYGSLIGPPTFPTCFRSPDWSMLDIIKDLKADIGKLLHGEQEYEYFRPIKPGDKFTCKVKIKDIYTKEGKAGAMDMVVTETDYVDNKGDLAARARAVLVIRS